MTLRIKVQVRRKTSIQAKFLTRFPSDVTALSPIVLDKTGGNFELSLDMNVIIASLPAGGVSSVFGRTGDVIAKSGDYTFAQIGSKPTTLSGYGITDAQPLDPDLTAISMLTTTTFGRSLLTINSYPTFNQNTTGSAASLTTPRNIDGQAFDGTADITVIAPGTHAAASKAVPVDADEIPLVDSAASNVLKKLTWANLKAAIVAFLVAGGFIREKLTADRNYYVRTDGSNSNNGLANTAGGAFLTGQKAFDVVCQNLDTAGFTVTIKFGNTGSFPEVTINKAWIGGGTLVFEGDTANMSNVVLTSATNHTFWFTAPLPAPLSLRYVKLANTNSGPPADLIRGEAQGTLTIENIDFGSTNQRHIIAAAPGCYIKSPIAGSAYKITGSCSTHAYGYTLGGVRINSSTYTMSGTLNWSAAFARATNSGTVLLQDNTYTGGTITGVRYAATTGGVIDTNTAAAANTLPGNAPGTTATGGQYN